jgi:hypothetical protein
VEQAVFENSNMIHCYRFLLFLLYSGVLGGLLIASLVGAADLYSVTGKSGTGNWNDKKGWSNNKKGCGQNGNVTGTTASDNVTICNGDTITVNANTSVAAANVVIASGGVLNNGSGGILNIGGNFTDNGTFTPSSGTVLFNGTVDQVINGTNTSTVFNNLTINKTLGTSLLLGDLTNASHNITVSNVLTLTSGLVQTAGGSASNYIYLSNSGGGLSAGSASSYINGNFRRSIATGTSTLNWPIGTANSYAPLSVTFSGVTVAGDLQASTTNGDSSSIASSQLSAAKSVNRVWSLAIFNNLAYVNVSPTFNFVAGDLDTGVNTNSLVAGRYYSSAWYYPEIGTRNSTSTQIIGLSQADGLGDFQLATPAPAPYSNWRMNQTSWNGTSGEVRDQGTGNPPGGYPATAAGTGGKPTTSRVAPALVGSPGSCNYGVFQRSGQQYLALSGYPKLGVDAGLTSFTVTGWLRTTDASLQSQPILVDDDGSSAGWGFGIDNSQLAFFSRTSIPMNFALNSWGGSNNTWYFVVAVHDAVNKIRKIYSYSASGNLNGSAIEGAPYTGSFAANAGSASIGGRAGADGFAGNLDEVKVFNAALSAAMLDSVRNMRNICPGARLNRYIYQREKF